MMDVIITPIFIVILCSYFYSHAYLFSRLIDSLRDSRNRLSDNQRITLFLAAILTPTLLLLLANLFMSGPSWKGGADTLGWIALTTVGDAGSTIMPIWLVACAVLSAGLLSKDNDGIYKNWINLMMILTLAAICLWRAGMVIGGDDTQAVMVIFPLPPGVNLLLLAIHIYRRRRFSFRIAPTVVTVSIWLGSLATTIYCKIILARELFAALPDVEPEKCFIVTAAAQGNRRFVGSRPDPTTGRMENAQLARMREFERYLIANHPTAHRLLRKVYNRVGPAVARRIRRPLVADIAYVMLKPLELLAVVICGRNALKRKAKR